MYATFYQLVRAESRRPEDNEFDRFRLQVDTALFQHYHEEIRFAALSIDGRGVSTYGDYSIVLREVAVRHRATVFTENSYLFFRHNEMKIGDPVPAGHRATWNDRGRLAGAKLGPKLDTDTHQEDFPSLLLAAGTTTANDDFIEVHIYGPVHRKAVERVVGPKQVRKADKVLLQDLKRKLRQVGAKYEACS